MTPAVRLASLCTKHLSNAQKTDWFTLSGMPEGELWGVFTGWHVLFLLLLFDHYLLPILHFSKISPRFLPAMELEVDMACIMQ